MKFLIMVLLGYLVYRMLRGKAAAPELPKEQRASETFQDPVCGMYISEGDAVIGNLNGTRHHFCSMDCLKRFEQIQQQR